MSAPHPRRNLTPWVLGLACFLTYSANLREVGGGDTVPATLIPLAIVRGDGPFLDRFAPWIRDPLGRIPGYGTDSRGHAVSRYPLGPALLAVPFELPQILLLDVIHPGWDTRPEPALKWTSLLAKNSAALIAALASVAVWYWLRQLGYGAVAVPVVLAVAFGSDMWSTGSQALWQHGPAALCFTLALLALSRPVPGSYALGLGGFFLALMVTCRPIDIAFAVPITLWVRLNFDRRQTWMFLWPVLAVALPLALYNVWFFKTLSGGYAQIEQMHPWAHGVKGTWSGNFLDGLTGTLLSPSHGLLIYSPWVLLGALGFWPLVRRWGWMSLEGALLGGLLATLVLLSLYSCWWAGHCFGPRFWIDASPVLALLLAESLAREDCWKRVRLGFFAFSLVVAASVQAVGFLCYPSTWHGQPTNADLDHKRLWDWVDTEVSRGLKEGIKPRVF